MSKTEEEWRLLSEYFAQELTFSKKRDILVDGNFEILLDRIEELEEKLISCCLTGNSVSGSLVLRKDLNRTLTKEEVDSNFILLKDLLDELFSIQEGCCLGSFLLTEDGDPLLTENDQNLVLE